MKNEIKHSTSQDQRALELSQMMVLLEQADSAFIVVDFDGKVLSWNPGAERLYGYRAEEINGRLYTVLLPERNAGEITKALDKIRRGRQLRARETEHLRKDGSVATVSFAIYPLHDDQGRIYAACTLTSDISEKKKAERALVESTSQIRAVVETVLDGIITINDRGIIDSFNPAAERIFGYRAHEVIGRNVKELMPEPYQSQHDAYLNNYLLTGQAKIIGIGREVQAMRKDGTVFPVDLAVAEMRFDGRRGFVGIIRDITERKEAEAELQKLNTALEEKVDELGSALERLQQTQDLLVQSEKMASLGELVAGVAHEINTPLGVCVTASSVLHNRVQELQKHYRENLLSRSEFEQFLQRMEQSSDMIMKNLNRAAELVRSFKQTAVDRATSQFRTFEVKPFLLDLLLSLQPELNRYPHKVDVACDDELEMKSYPGALAQVITNLIQNSLRHAYDEGQSGILRIEVTASGDMLDLYFSDDGRGIARDHIKQIFDPFFTTARYKGGTGIGLNVTYNLVSQALGGTIEVNSEPGKGTRFHIRVPLEREYHPQPRSSG